MEQPAVTFPASEPSLKVARPSTEKWAATLAEERRRLQEDMDALREREENLREYESRLRQLQTEIDAGRAAVVATGSTAPLPLPLRGTPPPFHRPSSLSPFHDDPSLQAAWEKLHRAREILEAEQKNLRDDRITMREQEIQMKRREEEVAEREARLAEREALVVAAAGALPASGAVEDGEHVSTVSRITRVPFDMARSVFGGKKSG